MNYNAAQYNEQRYNINGTFHITTLMDSVTETDANQLASFLKLLNDSFSFADTIIFSSDLQLSDAVFADDMIQIQFSNKALNDTIRLADWLSIERGQESTGWSD